MSPPVDPAKRLDRCNFDVHGWSPLGGLDLLVPGPTQQRVWQLTYIQAYVGMPHYFPRGGIFLEGLLMVCGPFQWHDCFFGPVSICATCASLGRNSFGPLGEHPVPALGGSFMLSALLGERKLVRWKALPHLCRRGFFYVIWHKNALFKTSVPHYEGNNSTAQPARPSWVQSITDRYLQWGFYGKQYAGPVIYIM